MSSIKYLPHTYLNYRINDGTLETTLTDLNGNIIIKLYLGDSVTFYLFLLLIHYLPIIFDE